MKNRSKARRRAVNSVAAACLGLALVGTASQQGVMSAVEGSPTADLTVSSAANAAPAPGSSTVAATADQIGTDLDLNNPRDGINDPAAALPFVDTECAPGDVDINLSSLASLQRGLRIDEPTARRLVAKRPWLSGGDLLSVPGIGPARLAELERSTCATQPALPPPTPMACTPATNRVDLQVASRSTISGRLGLPLSVADEIIAVRPLPQDLTQVITPRVPGLSGPTLSSLLKAKKICVTPAPVLAGGSAYRWGTASGGAVVERGEFALIVPPGRITESSGAYLQVTPLTPDPGGLPRMDAHIHGTWRTGTSTVVVQGPWQGPDGDRPAVFHYPDAGGANLSIGTNGAVVGDLNGNPVVYAALKSLSESVYGQTSCIPGFRPSELAAALCLDSLTDGDIGLAWLEGMRTVSAYVGQSVQAGTTDDCTPAIIETQHFFATTDGDPAAGLTCDLFANIMSDDQVVWNHRNYKRVALAGYTSMGAAYTLRVKSGPLDGRAVTRDPNENALEKWALNRIAENETAYPGQTVQLMKSASFVDTSVESYPDTGKTIAWVGVLKALSAFGDVVGGPAAAVSALTQQGLDCTGLTLGCVKSSMEAFAEAGQHSSDRTLAGRASTILRWAKPLNVGEAIGSISSTYLLQLKNDREYGGNFTLKNTPRLPTVDSHGRAVFKHCVYQLGNRYFVDEQCQENEYGTGTPPGDGPQPGCGLPPQNAFSGNWVGRIESCRLYNVLLRNASGTLHLVRLEGGDLVAHPIAAQDEWDFKEDWPEAEWRAEQFPSMVDRIGSTAVNDPLYIRQQTLGRGHSWLLRQPDGFTYYINENGVRIQVGHNAALQEQYSRSVLTLHPALWRNDICFYRTPGGTAPVC